MASSTPCWYCRHFESLDLSSRIAKCSAPGTAGFNVHSRDGCSIYEREPGVDDDGWSPPETPYARWQPAPARGASGHAAERQKPPRPGRPAARVPIPIFAVPRDAFGGMFDWDDDG